MLANNTIRNCNAVPQGTKSSEPGRGLTGSRMTANTVSNNVEGNGQWSCSYCTRVFPTKIGLGVHKSHVHRAELNEERLSQPRRVHEDTNGERRRNAISSRRPWTDDERVALAKLHLDIRVARPQDSEAAINRELANKLPGRTAESIKGQKKSIAFKEALARLTATSAVLSNNTQPIQQTTLAMVESGCDSTEATMAANSQAPLNVEFAASVELGTSDHEQTSRTIPSGTASEVPVKVASPPVADVMAPLAGDVTNTNSFVSRYNQIDRVLLEKLKEDAQLYAKHIRTKRCYGLQHLLHILLKYKRGDPIVSELLEVWLDITIKAVMGEDDVEENGGRVVDEEARRRQRQTVPMGHGSRKRLNRRARAREYVYLQRLYERRGLRAVAQHVLKDCEEVENTNDSEVPNTPTCESVYEFWKDAFTGTNGNNTDPKAHVNILSAACGERFSDDTAYANCTWVAISIDDIKRSEIANGKASGPDRITPKAWKLVPRSIRAMFYNVVMFHGVVLSNFAKSRTVLIPKARHPSKPDEYRPISIASVVGRQLHRIFANRLTAVLRNNDQQMAFRRGIDGTSNNLAIYRTIIEDARNAGKDIHVVSMDLQRAFPSVSHSALIETLSKLGCPTVCLNYLAQLYSKAKTYLELPSGKVSTCIRIRQGVLQGDPLSPCLFNLVMDKALRKLDDCFGYKCGVASISCMAFADDVNIIGRSVPGTQLNLNCWLAELRKDGLVPNPQKCRSLSMLWDGRRKTHTIETRSRFTIDGIHDIQAIGPTTKWKYLGIQLTGEKIDKHLPNITPKLDRVENALLKPQHKLELISKMILPSLNHQAVLGGATQAELISTDTQVRTVVRRIMHLPADVPNCYIHAPVRCGGMGIPELAVRIPISRYTRLKQFADSNARVAPQFDRSIAFRRNKEYAEKWLRDNELDFEKDNDLIAKYYNKRLDSHYATKGLSMAYNSRKSRSWAGKMSNEISGGDFVKYHQLSSYSIHTLARRNWGRNSSGEQSVNCRDGCNLPETMHHVLQECKRTHGGRVLRHNRALDLLFQELQRTWNGTAVVDKEPNILTPSGLRKPDLVFYNEAEKVAYVIDLHIVNGEYVKEARAHKMKQYRDVDGMTDCIKQRYKVENVWYQTVTATNIGIFCPATMELFKYLDISSYAIFKMATSILRGSWMNWSSFKRIHQQRFRQQPNP